MMPKLLMRFDDKWFASFSVSISAPRAHDENRRPRNLHEGIDYSYYYEQNDGGAVG